MQASFILASASPRRRELLGALISDFEIIPSDIDEKPLDGESPEAHVLRLSSEKALEVSRENPGRWILGADTVVIIDGKILGKPDTPGEAERMLGMLSGRTHRVITGFAIMKGDEGVTVNDTVESSVIFKDISRDEMDWYIRTSEPYDKAGGYAVQGKASFFIKEIRGSYTNVIGLPLCEVVTALKEAGALRLV
ncbi:MAG: septum formation protein Maf [Deltaproteobacteria bacterium]|nr:septum formation protein Maf [Deltaproteobacteria bacterium]MBW2651124.1 septum formation protein Maf [Deltaproteobacteria bacterium]